MKTLVIFTLALVLAPTLAHAEMTRFYDKSGRYVGTAITTSKHGTSFYGPGGGFEGSAVTNGRTATFFNAQGGFVGTVAPRR
jgi:hypothetical protein